jgi:hypothetical protein
MSQQFSKSFLPAAEQLAMPHIWGGEGNFSPWLQPVAR